MITRRRLGANYIATAAESIVLYNIIIVPTKAARAAIGSFRNRFAITLDVIVVSRFEYSIHTARNLRHYIFVFVNMVICQGNYS